MPVGCISTAESSPAGRLGEGSPPTAITRDLLSVFSAARSPASVCRALLRRRPLPDMCMTSMVIDDRAELPVTPGHRERTVNAWFRTAAQNALCSALHSPRRGWTSYATCTVGAARIAIAMGTMMAISNATTSRSTVGSRRLGSTSRWSLRAECARNGHVDLAHGKTRGEWQALRTGRPSRPGSVVLNARRAARRVTSDLVTRSRPDEWPTTGHAVDRFGRENARAAPLRRTPGAAGGP